MTWSINTRLIVAGAVVLACFLGFTGVTLDGVFRASAQEAVRERLQAYIYGLIADSQIGDDGSIGLVHALPETPLAFPGSGLYAQIHSNVGDHLWRSPSMGGVHIPFTGGLASTVQRFARLTTAQGTPVYALSFGVIWDQSGDPSRGYTFSIAETLDGYNAQVRGFRRSLWLWLGAVGIVLLAVQGTILRWGLAPLRRAAADLERIETGRRTELTGPYPRELRGLTDNLNALLHSQREHLDRYRHTLDDLAHSLKTPLAILRGALPQATTSEQELRGTVEQQVEAMSQIVNYQLQRAATSGRTVLTAPVAVAGLLLKVTASLDKVYADKRVELHLEVEPDAVFQGDEGDLLEVAGNLADNAYKCCLRRVAVAAGMEGGAQERRLVLRVEDDGPGIPRAVSKAVVRRGVRGDAATAGQGIGLAVVQDIVRVYGGELRIDTSRWNGARVSVRLPL